MSSENVLKDKIILVVDDEKDILELVEDALSGCIVHKAADYDTALQLLLSYTYDIVLLDIMGVNGFELLQIAQSRHVPVLMLTSHALDEKSLGRSIEEGAAYFVPKEKMADIATYAADVLEAKEKNQNPWVRWFKRLASTFDVAFTGPQWREQQKEFLEKLKRVDW